MMQWFGPGGLFGYAAVVSLALAAFVATRILLQWRPARPGGFIDFAPTTPATASLSPRADIASARAMEAAAPASEAD